MLNHDPGDLQYIFVLGMPLIRMSSDTNLEVVYNDETSRSIWYMVRANVFQSSNGQKCMVCVCVRARARVCMFVCCIKALFPL